MLITIDGPAGVGKGTIAQMLARHFGFVYLDTGLLFRQMAYVLLTQNVSLEDVAAVEHAVSDFNPTLAVDEHLLRTDDVSQAASKISVYDFVRKAQHRAQRAFLQQHGNVVMDGRDLGAYAFPEADKKLFFDATPEVRASRRIKDLEKRGIPATYAVILDSIIARDKRDRTRQHAPLKAAPDACVIDTSTLSIEEVFQKSLSFI